MSSLELRFNLQDPLVKKRQKAGQKHGRTVRYLREAQPLGPEQLEECRRDPAWEARNCVLDCVVCRICGAQVKTPLHNRASHLRSRHPGTTTADYSKRFPGAPLSSLAGMAHYYGKRERTVDEVRSERINDYVTPEELAACRMEPDWEKHQGMVDFVVCRHCGFKSRTELRDDRSGCHLNTHFLTKKHYMELYPSAPWRPEVRVMAQRELGRKWHAKVRKLIKSVTAGRPSKDEGEKGHNLKQQGLSWTQVTMKLARAEYNAKGQKAVNRIRQSVLYYRKTHKIK